MYIRLKKKPSIFINIDRFEFLEQIKNDVSTILRAARAEKACFLCRVARENGENIEDIFTMKSLILAQDER